MKYVLLVFGLLFVGCTTAPVEPGNPVGPVICAGETNLAAAYAATYAQVMNCAHPEKIKAKALAFLDTFQFCDKVSAARKSGKNRGLIADLVCPTMSTGLLVAVGTKVDPEYGCEPGADGSQLNDALTKACKQLNF